LVPGVEGLGVVFGERKALGVPSEAIEGSFGVGLVAESVLFASEVRSSLEYWLGAADEFVECDLRGGDVGGCRGDMFAGGSSS